MNILPFIAIFLIILAMFSSSSLQNSKIFMHEQKSSLGFLAADRQLEEAIQLAAFKNAREKKKEPKEKQDPKIPKEKIASLDDLEIIETNRSKIPTQPINLYCFFQENLDPKLAIIYENFFRSFYSSGSFYIHSSLKDDLKGFLERLSNQGVNLIKEMKKENKDTTTLTLLDFYPKGEDATLYYHMLKGTNFYNPITQTGYPALEEVFYYLPQKNTKIFSFKNLNPLMLEAIFSKEIAEDIIAKESEKRVADPKKASSTLNAEELKALLHQKHSFANLDKVIEFLDFSSAKKQNEFIKVIDKNTYIILKRKKKT